ncbi:MAG: electron transfer flavoprotein subunit alpha/FixB family protein [Thermodesulfobacteriota bacterium]
MTLPSNALMVAEHKDGKLTPLARSLTSKARIVADELKGELYALVLGEGLGAIIKELEDRGVDVIVTVDSSLPIYPEPDQVVKVIQKVVTDIPFRVILLGHSYLGIEVGPVLSTIWPSIFASNCFELEIGEKNWYLVRPLFDGLTHIRFNMNKDQMAVLNLQLLSSKKGPNERRHDPRLLKYSIEDCGLEKSPLTKLLEIIEPKIEGLDLTKSQIIIGVGRGIKSPDNLKPIFDLAESLGGAVSCSRPLVDLGWLPSQHLVGLSGATVTPKIYLALGISGAAQHLAGMLGSEVIVAINKNASAPIFNYAHYGLVADLFEVIPLLNEEVKKMKQLRS